MCLDILITEAFQYDRHRGDTRHEGRIIVFKLSRIRIRVAEMSDPLQNCLFLFTAAVRKHIHHWLEGLTAGEQHRYVSVFDSVASVVPGDERRDSIHTEKVSANQTRLSQYARDDPITFNFARIYAAKWVRTEVLCHVCTYVQRASAKEKDQMSLAFTSLETYMNFNSVPMSTYGQSFLLSTTDNSEQAMTFRRKRFDMMNPGNTTKSASFSGDTQKSTQAMAGTGARTSEGSQPSMVTGKGLSSSRVAYQWDKSTEDAVAKNFEQMRMAKAMRKERKDTLSSALPISTTTSTARDAFRPTGSRRKADVREEPDSFSSASTGRVLESHRLANKSMRPEDDTYRQMPSEFTYGSSARLTYRDPHGGFDRDTQRTIELLSQHDSKMIGVASLTNRPSKQFGDALTTSRADLRPPPSYFPAKGRPVIPPPTGQPYSTLADGFPDGCVSTARTDFQAWDPELMKMYK